MCKTVTTKPYEGFQNFNIPFSPTGCKRHKIFLRTWTYPHVNLLEHPTESVQAHCTEGEPLNDSTQLFFSKIILDLSRMLGNLKTEIQYSSSELKC